MAVAEQHLRDDALDAKVDRPDNEDLAAKQLDPQMPIRSRPTSGHVIA
jgi:hypothetical protein